MSSLLQQTIFTTSTLYNVYIRQFLQEPPFRIDNFYNITTNNFYIKRSLHQAPFTPGTLYTRHLFTRQLLQPKQFLHQVPFTPALFAPNKFTLDTFYTRQLSHQALFTPETLCAKLAPNNFDTTHLLHQTPFTPNNFYTRQLLHQTTCTTNNKFHTRRPRQTTFKEQPLRGSHPQRPFSAAFKEPSSHPELPLLAAILLWSGLVVSYGLVVRCSLTIEH